MNRIKYIGVLFFITLTTMWVKASVVYDSIAIKPRSLVQKPSEVYTGKEFVYEEVEREAGLPKMILWFFEKIAEFLRRIFSIEPSSQNSFSGERALKYTLLLLAIILIIIGFVFFINRFRNTLGRNEKSVLSAEEIEKNIDQINFDKLINSAVQNKDYRLAIRFYYLKMLKLMSDNGVINYEYQKTNYEYYYEMKQENAKELFKDISFVFDYSWYGYHQAGEEDFQIAVNKFEQMQRLISTFRK